MMILGSDKMNKYDLEERLIEFIGVTKNSLKSK